MVGKKIHINQDGHQKTATVTGLSPEGFLEICNENGKTETWMARRGLDISAQY